MADASMYDAMSDFGESDEMADTEEIETEEPEMDGELMMHAEALGFGDPAKAKALKGFIERCVALKDEGEYEAPAAEEESLGDEDLEI